MYKPFIAYGGFLSVDRILKLVVFPVPCTACRIIGSFVPPNTAEPNVESEEPNTAGILTLGE